MSEASHDTKYHITLLRHGESVGNADGYYQGQSEFGLTERGRKQAHALANRWLDEGKKFDQAIASPLARARETAEIVSEYLEIPLQLNPLWMEINLGRISGLKPEEANEKYPLPDFTNPYFHTGITGESRWELFLRAGRVIQDMLQHPPGNYLIVSHGGILNMTLYAILGIVPHANFSGPRFIFDNTAFATLTYRPAQHVWRVWGINDHEHWPN